MAPANKQNKAKEFSVVSSYKLGYRNREDITNLPPGVLIVGSQNVLTNVSERIQIRQGYALDGATSSVASSIESSFDWLTRNNGERHLRAGFLTSAANDGKLQYRYVNSAGAVTWRDLLTGLSTVSFNFTKFWNNSQSVREALFVDGTAKIRAWNGAYTELLSATATTLTKSGDTWLDTGFYDQTLATIGSSTSQFDITNPSGTTYRYTWDTTGTDPAISATTVPTGSYILIAAQNFNAANNGLFVVTASGSNYFEVTNASGVAESNKTIGTGYIYAKFINVVIVNGTAYGYTGGVDTTTLTGVTPSAASLVAGDIVHQAVITTPNTGMTSITSTFKNGLISTLNNQVFVGSLTSSVVWISKVNSYIDYSSNTPRQTGDGASLILDDNIVAFEPQEQYMYVSAGKDLWYNVNFELQTSTVGVTYEQVNALPLKTGRQQGAKSQAFVSHMKNNIILVSNEPTIDTFGRIETSLATPQTVNISDPIKLDVDSYDFTGGSIFYWRYYILVAIPAEELVLMYNLATNSWEAPQTIPVTRFYIVDGELYGHSSQTSESYHLFTGYADRVYSGFEGFPISAKASFSYQNYGTRYAYKKANSFYIEGYINANTTLECTLTYELDGCATTKTFEVAGDDSQIVCISPTSGSLGKNSLGKEKLGGENTDSLQGLPPKFRVEKTFNNTNFFEVSFSFEILGADQRFELLAFGLNAGLAPEEPVKVRQ